MRTKKVFGVILSVCILINVLCVSTLALDEGIPLFSDDFEDYEINSTYLTGHNVAIGTSWITKSLDMGYDNLAKYGIVADPKDLNNKVLMLESRAAWNGNWAFPEIKCTSAELNTSNSYIIDTDIYTSDYRAGVGVRFMMHNSGKNYYELYFPGGSSTGQNWLLNKVTNGTSELLAQSTYTGKWAEKIWLNLKIAIDGNKISWTTTNKTTGNVAISLSGSSTITLPFTAITSSSVSLFAAGQSGQYGYFNNFKVNEMEPSNVIYYDAAAGKSISDAGVLDMENKYKMCRIMMSGLSSSADTLYLEAANEIAGTWTRLTSIDKTYEMWEWVNTATNGAYRYLRIVTDGETLPTGIGIKILTDIPSKIEMIKSEPLKLYPRLGKVDVSGTVVWSSSDESVAVVENDILTGVNSGTAIITATVGSNSISFNVNVNLFIDSFESYAINNTLLTGCNIPIGDTWVSKTQNMGYDGNAKYGIVADPTVATNKVLMLEARTTWNSYSSFPEIKFNGPQIDTSNKYTIVSDIYTNDYRVGVGVRFMVHNNGNNFYELYFPNTESSSGSNCILTKVTDGTRVLIGESSSTAKWVQKIWLNLTITVDGNNVSWTVKNIATGNISTSLSGSSTIISPFTENVASSISLFDAGCSSQNCYFDNFKVIGNEYVEEIPYDGIYRDNGNNTITVKIDPNLYNVQEKINVITAFYSLDNVLIKSDVRTIDDLSRVSELTFNKDLTPGAFGRIFVWGDALSNASPLIPATIIK